jgi:hypothetical protein
VKASFCCLIWPIRYFAPSLNRTNHSPDVGHVVACTLFSSWAYSVSAL